MSNASSSIEYKGLDSSTRLDQWYRKSESIYELMSGLWL